MLEEEYYYYQRNKENLLKKYLNRYLVIIGNKIIGDYSSYEEALYKTQEKYELGSFLIQKCSSEDIVQIFHSRVMVI